MTGISRTERAILGLMLGFLLLSGGHFMLQQRAVVTSGVDTRQPPAASTSVDGGQRGPDSLLEGERINVNTADVYDLQRLPGIGEKRAQDIVSYREANGPFACVEDLCQVTGIGEGTVEKLKDYATV